MLYYVVQKPGLLNIFAGLLDTLWAILVAAILLFNTYELGGIALGQPGLFRDAAQLANKMSSLFLYRSAS